MEDVWLEYFKQDLGLVAVLKQWQKERYISDESWLLLYDHLFPLKRQHEVVTFKGELAGQGDLKRLQLANPQAGYDFLEIERESILVISKTVFAFILQDNHFKAHEWLVLAACKYLQKDLDEEDVVRIHRRALAKAIYYSNPIYRKAHVLKSISSMFSDIKLKNWLRNYYVFLHGWGGDYLNQDIYTRFKMIVWCCLGSPLVDIDQLPDKEFIAKFKKEWKRILSYSDEYFDFKVHPRFRFKNFGRFASLCSRRDPYLKQMIEYVGRKIIPRKQITIESMDLEIQQGWMDLLKQLTQPYIQTALKSVKATQKEEVSEYIKQDIERWIQDFDYDFKRKGRPNAFALDLLDGRSGHIPLSTTFPGFFPEEMIQKNPSIAQHARWIRISTYLEQKIFYKYGPEEHVRLRTHDAVERENITIDEKSYLTVEGVAKILGCSCQTARNMEKSGVIKFQRILKKGKEMRICSFEQVKVLKKIRYQRIKIKELAGILKITPQHLRRLAAKNIPTGLQPADRKERLIKMVFEMLKTK